MPSNSKGEWGCTHCGGSGWVRDGHGGAGRTNCPKCGGHGYGSGGTRGPSGAKLLLGFGLFIGIIGVGCCGGAIVGLSKMFKQALDGGAQNREAPDPAAFGPRRFINKASPDNVLDFQDSNAKAAGGLLQLSHRADEKETQVFIVGNTSEAGSYAIWSRRITSINLGADADEANKNGCPARMSKDLKQANQRWRLEKVGEYYKIINRASGKVLQAAPDQVLKDRCPIQLWDDNPGDHCLWKLQAVANAGGKKS